MEVSHLKVVTEHKRLVITGMLLLGIFMGCAGLSSAYAKYTKEVQVSTSFHVQVENNGNGLLLYNMRRGIFNGEDLPVEEGA